MQLVKLSVVLFTVGILMSPAMANAANGKSASAKTKYPDVSGTWAFSHMNGKFRGFIELHQTGDQLTGTWHTTVSDKKEEDNPVVGSLSKDTVWLFKAIAGNYC